MAPMHDEVCVIVHARGPLGLTVAEVREVYPEKHHGSISAILSRLHEQGHLVLLTERRGKARVYVAPPYVEGRETVPHGVRSYTARALAAKVRAALDADDAEKIDKDVIRQVLPSA